jgi:hypothetical protein
MNQIAPGLPRDGNNPLAIKVARISGLAQLAVIVRTAPMKRCTIVGRIQRDRLQTEFPSGLPDADSDLATVGDQKLAHASSVSLRKFDISAR